MSWIKETLDNLSDELTCPIVVNAREHREILRLARIGLEFEALKQSDDFTLIVKRGADNAAESLLHGFIDMRAELLLSLNECFCDDVGDKPQCEKCVRRTALYNKVK